MAAHCRDNNGVGLAANQVGIRENFFFISARVRMAGNLGGGLCINPSYVPVSAVKVGDVEGCLSLPKRLFVQERYASIDATWTNTRGHTLTRRLKGFAARVFQHEYDHLLGLNLTMTGVEIVKGGRKTSASVEPEAGAPAPAAQPQEAPPEPQEQADCSSEAPQAGPDTPSHTE